MSEWTECEQVH